MSKIGRLPIKLTPGVEVKLEGNLVIVKGPKGTLEQKLPSSITLKVEENVVKLTSNDETKVGKSKYGTLRALVSNMVDGVTMGWAKQLELVGTGFKAETTGKILTLQVGFSHPVKVEAPEGILFKVEKNIITVEGINKEVVGQISAEIRAKKPPEPYKGKGIKYIDEIIRRKAGKAAKTAGAPA